MANTASDNALAQAAFKAMYGRYGKYLNMNPSVKSFCQVMVLGKGIEVYVKFMDDAPFTSNLSSIGSLGRASNCRTCGFTSPKLGNKYDREMYINRSYANASTVVHEMLHFVTHPLFWGYVGPAVTESVTEYFTRKVIRSSTDTNFDISQRAGRYDQHHTYLSMQRQDVKKTGDRPQKGYMKAAYFQGDLTSIAFIKKRFNDIEEILAADEG